jgi:hypothetical protein
VDLKKMKLFSDMMPCTYLQIPKGFLPYSIWLFAIARSGIGLYAHLETSPEECS